MKKLLFIIFTLLILNLQIAAIAEDKKILGHGYDFEGNGKRDFPCFGYIYQKQELPDAIVKPDKKQLDLALNRQAPVLKNKQVGHWHNEGLKITTRDLKGLTDIFVALPQEITTAELSQTFDAFLMRGEDGCGNTQFTAYYTPVIKVKENPDEIFHYPLYRQPKPWPQGKALTRQQIDGEGGLEGHNLEVAWSGSLLDNYFLQVQGSGFAEYLDTGEKVTLQYGGQNGFAYKSLGRYLVENNYISADKISLQAIRDFFDAYPEKLEPFLSINPSYTFFRKIKYGPLGSLNTTVVPMVSIAVDPKFIPLGAVLLAEIPVLNEQGLVTDHRFTLFVAQDTGGAIRGTGHVDIYMGAGAAAREKAGKMHHYGRLWLLLPKISKAAEK